MIDTLKKRALFTILILTLIVLVGHYFFLENLLPIKYESNSYWLIYTYIIPTSILGYLFVSHRFKKNAESAGRAAMAFSITKMIGSLLFLSPWLMNKTLYSKPFALQFMLVFFIFLFVETVLFARLLNSSKNKLNK